MTVLKNHNNKVALLLSIVIIGTITLHGLPVHGWKIAISKMVLQSYAQESDNLLSDDLLGVDLSDDELLSDDDDERLEFNDEVKELDETAQAHLAIFTENKYPLANICKVCHEDHYKEWSVSQHAYA